MKAFTLILVLYHFNLCIAQDNWENPIIKKGRLGSPLVETSPFVFNEKLYLLESNQRFWEIPGAKPGDFFHEDEIRIKDLENGQIVSVPLKNHAFGNALTWNGRVYVFAGNYGENKPWRQITEISMTSSSNLINWTKPVTVLRANEGEVFFNTSVCRGKDNFILLYETNDKSWTPFTFRYMESSDLKNWKEIPGAIYGKTKYVGGPGLYYEGGWYYTLYLESPRTLESVANGYETRITRSKDLVNWEDASIDRPFITFDPSHKNIPLLDPEITESNASDAALCYFNGKTIIFFTGSDQSTAGDLQWATYDGTPKQLFEHFFSEVNISDSDTIPPEHVGDWAPVLQAPSGNIKEKTNNLSDSDCIPTPQQLAYQERQLGAFIHFGPATFLNSDFMIVPEPEIFNPIKLDAEQWVRTARSFGAKHIVLTAKHHNGFCLWPTKTTEYSVKNSPWKNGNGDVVAGFVEACKKYNIKPGLYISGGDKYFGCTSTPDPQGERKIVGDVDAYFPVFLEQLRELLTSYGEIDIIWFDGAYDPFGWDVMNSETLERLGTGYGDAIRTMVKNLQPQAVVFGGTRPDVRWSGSEKGWAPYPLWNCVNSNTWSESWVGPENLGWIPAEANIHTRKTWFWSPGSDHTLKDVSSLINVYLETIGRGANLLINMTPDTTGIIPEIETDILKSLGDSLQNIFSKPKAEIIFPEYIKETGYFELELSRSSDIRMIEIEEDIERGQRVAQYVIEYLSAGDWLTLTEGQSIGRKRLHNINYLRADKLRLVITKSDGDAVIKKFAAY